MYELYYHDGLGSMSVVATFATKEECLAKAETDGQASYMIELEVDGEVLMVISC